MFHFYNEMFKKAADAYGATREMADYMGSIPGPNKTEIKERAIEIWENSTSDTFREEGLDVFQMFDPYNQMYFKSDKQIEEWQELLNDELKEEGYLVKILIQRQYFNQMATQTYEIFVQSIRGFETVKDWLTETEAVKEAA